MNKKFAIAAIITVIVGAGAYWFSILSSEVALFERFPEIDNKIVVKAHRIFVRRSYAGKYNHIEMTDEACDRIFLDIVKEITK